MRVPRRVLAERRGPVEPEGIEIVRIRLDAGWETERGHLRVDSWRAVVVYLRCNRGGTIHISHGGYSSLWAFRKTCWVDE